MRKLKQSTRDKYTKFIQDCCSRKFFDKDEMRLLYKADTNIWTALHRTNMIRKTDNCATGMCQWIGPNYSDAVLLKIMEEYATINAMKNLKQKRKRFLIRSSPQLTMQPIKRIERVATMPVRVQEEPIHDTSNSKMFLLMAVGTAIGFLIATIIWK